VFKIYAYELVKEEKKPSLEPTHHKVENASPAAADVQAKAKEEPSKADG
jgi:hypothetical protein